jgi:biopolymer transport protein TolR
MRRHRKPVNQINVVPYIDVMLVLLVIFMVTAPLVAPGEIELPSVGSKLTVPVQPLQVTIQAKNVLFLDDQATKSGRVRVSKDDLVARVLAKQQPGQEQPVVIAADGKASYQDVLDILDLLQRSGVKKVGLLARPPAS